MTDTALTIAGNLLALIAMGGLFYMIFVRPFQ